MIRCEKIMEENMVAFKWKLGDTIAIDNWTV